MVLASVSGISQGISIGPGAFVTIQDNAFVKTTGSAGLTILSSSQATGSLIAGSDAVEILGTGTASAQRYINNNNQWHFLSAPLGAGSQVIWPEFAPTPSAGIFGGDFNWDFYYWNPNCSYTNGLPWVNLRMDGGLYNNGEIEATGNGAGFGASPAHFEAGRGYLVAYAGTWPSTIHTFTGPLHSGTISRTITRNTTVEGGNSWNLAGNPYPSSIDWSAATGWNRSNLKESEGGGYDYWILTSSGNFGVCNSGSSTGTLGTTNYIAPMQGFFVDAAGTGTFSMDDRVQKHSGQSFLKATESEVNMIRLRLTTDLSSLHDEMIVDLRSQTQEGGSRKFRSIDATAPEIWATRNSKKYSILRFSSFSDELQIPVSVRCGMDGSYSIIAEDLNAFTHSDQVYLDDLKTGERVNLRENPVFNFFGTPGDATDRFRISFRNGTGLMEGSTQIFPFKLYLSGIEAWIINTASESGRADIRITDAMGRIVYSQRDLLVPGRQMLTSLKSAGVYFATIQSDKRIVTLKLIAK